MTPDQKPMSVLEIETGLVGAEEKRYSREEIMGFLESGFREMRRREWVMPELHSFRLLVNRNDEADGYYEEYQDETECQWAKIQIQLSVHWTPLATDDDNFFRV